MRLDKWQGDFGNDYIERNKESDNRYLMWKRIISELPTVPVSILEVGANIGLNLNEINTIISSRLTGLEPNRLARSKIIFGSSSLHT